MDPLRFLPPDTTPMSTTETRPCPPSRPRTLTALFVLGALGAPLPAAADPGGTTELVSISTLGVQGNGLSGFGFAAQRTSLSGNGRVIAFLSDADNLVAGDTNGFRDVFVRDLDLDTTTRVSVSSSGLQADDDLLDCDISYDGRYVTMTTRASTLVPGDTNGQRDVFFHDRVLGTTTLISVGLNGAPGNNGSESGRVSADGRYIAFWSGASNIIPVDLNSLGDIFLYDRFFDTVTLVTVSTDGTQANDNCAFPDISPDGRYVVFASRADNLRSGDTNGSYDIFVRDLLLGVTLGAGPPLTAPVWQGDSIRPSVSADGSQVVFESAAENVVTPDGNGTSDVFLWTVATGAIQRLSEDGAGTVGDDQSRRAEISADGHYASFESRADNLLASDTNFTTDVFVADLVLGGLTVASLTHAGLPGNFLSTDGSISEDGSFVAFTSPATNMVPGDVNGQYDVFVRMCAAPAPVRYCSTSVNSIGCMPAIIWFGVPSATSATAFFRLEAVFTRNQQSGILIYSTTGPANVPFGLGTLCLAPNIVRTPVQNSGGSPLSVADCTGRFTYPFNFHIASGIDPALVAGATVWAQYWSRDPGFAPPNNTSLTDAVRFVIGP